MKLWIFSDLHVDVPNTSAPYILPERPDQTNDCDVVIIAGDVREDYTKSVKWILAQDFKKPVVFVGGNHEGYRCSRDYTSEKAKQLTVGTNIHFLQDESVIIQDTIFCGATLWTDFLLYGESQFFQARYTAYKTMNDYSLIRFKNNNWGKFTPMESVSEHNKSKEFIAETLEKNQNKKRVVVTHHAPSIKSIHPKYGDNLLNAAYASDCEALVDRSTLWVHGHVHTSFDYTMGDGRVICNPAGYRDKKTGLENKTFNPRLIVEI
jgi:Icc-related predicted phosphoesterase